MYDLNDLEKKWISYKRAKYRRFFSLFAAFAAVAVISAFVSYLVFAPSTVGGDAKMESNRSVAQKTEAQKDEVVELKLGGAGEPQREIVIISPNRDGGGFVNSQPITPLSFEELGGGERQSVYQTVQQPQMQQPQMQQPQPQPQPIKPKTEPKISIETKSADTVAILEERYKKNGNFDTALLLCDEYYKRGEYEKALSWAIKANSLDAKNEKSWILFARSSAKLGRKSDAINALESYLRTNNSDSVRAALRQIRSGEI